MQQIIAEPKTVYLPKEVVYSDGTYAILPEDYVLREGNLRLYVPPNKIENVVNSLIASGFYEENLLRFYKREKFSLVKKFYDIWELHIRIYEDGFMDAHFEVSRDYLEHLNYPTIPSIYEPFEFYKNVYNNFLIFDNVAKKFINEVIDNYKFTLNPPRTLTPWKPIFITLAAIGIFVYALSRLGETSRN